MDTGGIGLGGKFSSPSLRCEAIVDETGDLEVGLPPNTNCELSRFHARLIYSPFAARAAWHSRKFRECHAT